MLAGILASAGAANNKMVAPVVPPCLTPTGSPSPVDCLSRTGESSHLGSSMAALLVPPSCYWVLLPRPVCLQAWAIMHCMLHKPVCAPAFSLCR